MRKVFIVAAMAFLAMGAQAQNLVKNGNFDTPLNNEKTYASIPSTEDWFAFDKTNGATTISPATDDEKHGNAVQIETTTDNSWYKAYLGQRIQGAEKAVYTLSFDMKALTDGAQVRFFIRDAKTITFSSCVKDLTSVTNQPKTSLLQLIAVSSKKQEDGLKFLQVLIFQKRSMLLPASKA